MLVEPKEARRMAASPAKKIEPLIVRVPLGTYSALQLAQPFAKRRTMQDLLTTIIDEFLENLRAKDPGFEKALLGLRESEAREEGVLTRRSATRNHSAG
jgi:hypothetical protein